MSGGMLTTAVVGRLPRGICTCVEAPSRSVVGGSSLRSGKKLVRARSNGERGCRAGRRRSVVLQSSLTNAWQDWRMSARVLARLVPTGRGEHHGPLVVNELGGNYEESFSDVDKHLLDYFTYKAVRTVLAQLAEMNPHEYAWFYNFVVNNKPQDSKVFIRLLVKEQQELGERVMVTRLHLFNKWVKKYNHAQLHKAISDQNLELLRERLIQTVKFSNSSGDDIERPPMSS